MVIKLSMCITPTDYQSLYVHVFIDLKLYFHGHVDYIIKLLGHICTVTFLSSSLDFFIDVIFYLRPKLEHTSLV